MPNTLYDYYSAAGQALPNVAARGSIYEKAGLGGANTYTGSAAQNTALLGSLMKTSPVKLPTAPVGALAPTTAAPTPITIAADSAQKPATLYQTPTPPQQPNYSATLAGIPTIESIMGNKSPEQVSEETANKTLQDRILGVLNGLGGKAAATTQAESDAGVPALQQNLNDVNSQIVALQNEAKAIPLQDQEDAKGRGITELGLAPIDASKLRNNAIKALGLSSIAATLQGNLGLAEAQVTKKIAAMFEPMQDQLNYLKQSLDFNMANLHEDDKKQAAVIQEKLQARQESLDQAKSDHTTTMGYVLQAAKAGAPAATLSKAQDMAPVDAMQLLKQYLPSDAKPIDVSKGGTLVDPITGKVIYKDNSGGGASANFSQTQINKGAAASGMGEDGFRALDYETQNYFVNTFGTSQLKKDIAAIGTANGSTKEEIAANIAQSNIPDGAKHAIYSMIGVNPAQAGAPAPAQGGVLNTVKNWLGGWISG